MTTLIGADPELFAFEGSTAISVHNLLKGTKANPFPVPRGAVQVDGVAAEFNIEPTANKEIFLSRISGVKEKMERMIQKKNPNIHLVAKPSVTFMKDYWDSVPLLNKELGCDPDFNAYTGKENPRPDPTKLPDPTLRTGSGHIHIGWRDPSIPFKNEDEKDSHFLDCRVFTMILDGLILKYVGRWDSDKTRQSLYGRPGAFRPKNYGLEYRVLSNSWVDKPEIAGWLFDTVKFASEVRFSISMKNRFFMQKDHTLYRFSDYYFGSVFYNSPKFPAGYKNG